MLRLVMVLVVLAGTALVVRTNQEIRKAARFARASGSQEQGPG